MKMKNFENILIQMTKPEVSQLKHQDILANAIIKAKDKSGNKVEKTGTIMIVN